MAELIRYATELPDVRPNAQAPGTVSAELAERSGAERGDAIRRAGRGAADAAFTGLDIWADIQNRRAQRRATDAYNYLQRMNDDLLEKQDEGLLTRRGRETDGLQEEYGVKWQAILAKASDGLSSMEIDLLKPHADALRMSSLSAVRRHSTGELQRYDAQQAKSTLDLAIQSATGQYTAGQEAIDEQHGAQLGDAADGAAVDPKAADARTAAIGAAAAADDAESVRAWQGRIDSAWGQAEPAMRRMGMSPASIAIQMSRYYDDASAALVERHIALGQFDRADRLLSSPGTLRLMPETASKLRDDVDRSRRNAAARASAAAAADDDKVQAEAQDWLAQDVRRLTDGTGGDYFRGLVGRASDPAVKARFNAEALRLDGLAQNAKEQRDAAARQADEAGLSSLLLEISGDRKLGAKDAVARVAAYAAEHPGAKAAADKWAIAANNDENARLAALDAAADAKVRAARLEAVGRNNATLVRALSCGQLIDSQGRVTWLSPQQMRARADELFKLRDDGGSPSSAAISEKQYQDIMSAADKMGDDRVSAFCGWVNATYLGSYQKAVVPGTYGYEISQSQTGKQRLGPVSLVTIGGTRVAASGMIDVMDKIRSRLCDPRNQNYTLEQAKADFRSLAAGDITAAASDMMMRKSVYGAYW